MPSSKSKPTRSSRNNTEVGEMEKITVKQARNQDAVGKAVTVQGWIRTRRDSKGGFSFLELNDGSCLANMQIVADAKLPNYESEIKHLSAGCSVTVHGEVKASGGKEQATEVHAAEVIVHGWADPEAYPLQKKRHSFEKLREWAHLRPRTNTFGAVARVRNRICRSIHDFFQEEGFLYIHTPIITASDCEGAGEMFRVTTLDLGQAAANGDGKIDYAQDFFGKPAYLTVSGQLEGEIYAYCARQDLHVRPDVPRRELATRRGTSPSSGWSSPKWRSTSSTTTWHLAERFLKRICPRRAGRLPGRHAVLPRARRQDRASTRSKQSSPTTSAA